jgi:nucleoside-diphosphate kinase
VNRTLVICKPDAVKRGLVGEIVSRLERKGLRLVALEHRTLTTEVAAEHYNEHHGKPFYDSLIEFITEAPSVLLVVEGPQTRGRSCGR